MMTREETVSLLQSMDTGDDAEIEHKNADDALCNFLVTLGYDDVVMAYRDAQDRVGFWYA